MWAINISVSSSNYLNNGGTGSDIIEYGSIKTVMPMEVGLLDSIGASFITHINDNALDSSVVLVGPATDNDKNPAVIRLVKVDSEFFDARIQNWNYLSNNHAAESAPFLRLPEGNYKMKDGTLVEVGSYGSTAANGNFESVLFDTKFTKTPYLFLMIQTSNGSDAVNMVAKNVKADGFQATMLEQESLSATTHALEKIAYIAIQPGSGTSGVINSNFSVDYTVGSLSMTHAHTAIGSETFYLQEEQSKDSETAHTNAETVHILQIGGYSFMQQVTANGSDPTSIRKQTN